MIISSLFHCSESDKACILLYFLDCFDKYHSGHRSALHRGEDVEELDKEARAAVREEPMIAIRAAANRSPTVLL